MPHIQVINHPAIDAAFKQLSPAFSNRDHPAEPDAVINTGGPACMRLHLKPMESQVLVRKTED